MQEIIIILIINPMNAKNYDFDTLKLPEDAKLLILSDAFTLNTYLKGKNFWTKEIPLAHYENTSFSFLDLNAIEAVIKNYCQMGNYDIRLHSESELFLDSIAHFNEKYKLQGLYPDQMKVFRNKYAMKEALGNRPTQFVIPRYTKNLHNACSFSFPVIIKPLALGGCIGIRKFNTSMDLIQWVQSEKLKHFIVEEFIEGDLIKCNALVYQGKIKFFLCGKTFNPFEYALSHMSYIGSEVIWDETLSSPLLKATLEIVELLSIENGLIHVEFIKREDTLYFIEIALRPPGAWTATEYWLAYGIRIMNEHLYTAYPTHDFQFPLIPPLKFPYCCGIYLLRTNNATIRDIYIPSLSCDFIYHPFLDKWKATQKTNSFLDAIGEIFLFSSDEKIYQENLNRFIKEHKIMGLL